MDCSYEDDPERAVGTDRSPISVLLAGSLEDGLLEPAGRSGERLSVARRETADEALSALEAEVFDGFVCTDSLPDTSCTELVERVRERFPTLPVVLVATTGSERLASEAISAGVDEYVPADRTGGSLAKQVGETVDDSRNCIQRGELDGIEAAVEHAADAILITDPDGVIEYVNPAFEEVTGYGRRQAVGRTPRILKSGEQDSEYYERMWSAILDGEVWEETITNETRSGERYVAHQTVAPVTTDCGEIRHFVGIQRDVTKQRRLERQVERSEATLSRLYDVTTDESLAIEEKIETALSVCARHLDFPVGYFTHIDGGTQEILAATGDHEAIRVGATDPIERTYCRRTIDSDRPVVLADAESEGWEEDPAYEHFGLRCYLGAKVVVDGEVYGTLCFAGREPRDRLLLDAQQSTVRALANWIGYELERERHKIKLERQNERVEKFASAVSHDLRNPLNIAQAHAEMSRDGDTDEHIDRVTEAHERMETIIQDTLTLAREGELVESREELSLDRIARACWRSVETGDGTLRVEDDATIRGDGDKLRHLFENIFRNAVEHAPTSTQSDDGNPAPTIRVGPTDSGFYIEDDGPGIPPDEREQVFEYGYSTEGGSGFGLSIVETIASAHGWSVHVTDGRAGGARFEVDTEGEAEKRLVY
jgi:PAS domain S-box-containing protein